MSELRVQKTNAEEIAQMTRKTRITASLATLVVAAAAGSTAWGVVAQSPESATPPPAGACYIEDPDCNDTPGFLDPDVAVGEIDFDDPVGEAPAPAEPVQPDA
jgi:hypothetical protein